MEPRLHELLNHSISCQSTSQNPIEMEKYGFSGVRVLRLTNASGWCGIAIRSPGHAREDKIYVLPRKVVKGQFEIHGHCGTVSGLGTLTTFICTFTSDIALAILLRPLSNINLNNFCAKKRELIWVQRNLPESADFQSHSGVVILLCQ